MLESLRLSLPLTYLIKIAAVPLVTNDGGRAIQTRGMSGHSKRVFKIAGAQVIPASAIVLREGAGATCGFYLSFSLKSRGR
jgi:hypothetical protein